MDKEKMTEKDVKFLLSKRYCAPQFAFLTNVGNSTGFATRWADGVSVSLWPSSGFLVQGFEIKVSRSDFLLELKHPEKSQDIMQYCDRWWLVAPKGVAAKEEVPKNWGFLEIRGSGKIFTVKPAPDLESKQMSMNFLASLLRRATESVTPNEFLDEEKKIMKGIIKIDFEEKMARYEENIENLKKDIETFETHSGVKIREYSNTAEKIGKAVRFILDGGLNGLSWDIERMVSGAERVLKCKKDLTEILKISEKYQNIKDKL
jgi:hypothetical protein